MRTFFALLISFSLVLSSNQVWSESTLLSPTDKIRLEIQENQFGTIHQANSEPIDFGPVVALLFVLPIALNISTFTSMVGSSYFLYQHGLDRLKLSDKRPLNWGITSCVFGTASILYSGFMMFPLIYFGIWQIGVALLITGIVTLALGIRNIVLYNADRVKKDVNTQFNYYNSTEPFLISFSKSSISFHF